MSLLRYSDVVKSFASEQGQKEVLKGVSLSMEEHKVKALLGRSGSGKTTLLRLAAGFLFPDAGTVRFCGAPVTGPGAERFMIFQDYNQLFPWKRVADNIVFALRANNRSLSKKDALEQAIFWLGEMELSESVRSWPSELSGGMKQRAALARAFALRPRLLLLDEPFAGLDALLRRSMQRLLLSQCEKHGMSALFVTHDIDEAMALDASPAVLLPDGGAIAALSGRENVREEILKLLGTH